MNARRLLIALLFGAVLSVARLNAADPLQIPLNMADAARPLSAEEEIQMGREVAANVIAQFGLVDDPALADYVNLVGLTVAMAAPRQDVPYRFAVLDTDIINAFAAPGGYIFVTKGLLKILKDEAQLAAVLGHEVAHVSQRHIAKELQKSKLAKAVIPDYVKASAQKAEWMNQISGLAVQMMWKGLAREDELESDRLGVEYARAAGYDAASFAEVLQSLKARAQQNGSDEQLKFLLSTHPKPEDRLAAVAQRAAQFPAGGERLSERFQSQVRW